eukprot:TRINITY_DN1563_c0_g1_i3.p1 TRINITY_DN1563_c0_g1~~TRINITY_DN1563_c0_g1_i3.p1  ORF type:complete len:472 (+),score=101.27 TRINITY_DN1563_c0_g1_i3:889-2304(+)
MDEDSDSMRSSSRSEKCLDILEDSGEFVKGDVLDLSLLPSLNSRKSAEKSGERTLVSGKYSGNRKESQNGLDTSVTILSFLQVDERRQVKNVKPQENDDLKKCSRSLDHSLSKRRKEAEVGTMKTSVSPQFSYSIEMQQDSFRLGSGRESQTSKGLGAVKGLQRRPPKHSRPQSKEHPLAAETKSLKLDDARVSTIQPSQRNCFDSPICEFVANREWSEEGKVVAMSERPAEEVQSKETNGSGQVWGEAMSTAKLNENYHKEIQAEMASRIEELERTNYNYEMRIQELEVQLTKERPISSSRAEVDFRALYSDLVNQIEVLGGPLVQDVADSWEGKHRKVVEWIAELQQQNEHFRHLLDQKYKEPKGEIGRSVILGKAGRIAEKFNRERPKESVVSHAAIKSQQQTRRSQKFTSEGDREKDESRGIDDLLEFILAKNQVRQPTGVRRRGKGDSGPIEKSVNGLFHHKLNKK